MITKHTHKDLKNKRYKKRSLVMEHG